MTALSVPFIAQFGPWPTLIVAVAMTAIGIFFGLFYFGKKKAA
ncbi:hypothetical protein [Halobacillus sp. GSS1]